MTHSHPALDLVGVGEAMVLLEPPAGCTLRDTPTLDVQVAGAEFNACAAVAALGGSAVLATRLGADPLGKRVFDAGARLGVRVEASLDEVRPTGVFFKDPDHSGDRRVFYYRTGSAASRLSRSDAGRILALHPRSVLLSGLTAALGPGPELLVRALAASASFAGTMVIVDANLRPSLGRLDAASATIRDLLPLTDILIIGTDEAMPIFDTAEPTRIAASARAAGCREVVVKAGPNGCYWFSRDGHPRHVPSLAVDVVDPVGAGDAFAGAYIRSRLLGLHPGDAAMFATRFAAVIVGTHGDVAQPDSAVVTRVREDLLEYVSR